MRGLANWFTLMVPYLALRRSRYPDMPKPGGVDRIGAAYRGVAGHPADYLVRYGVVRLPYARAAPRLAVRPAGPAPLRVPGAPCEAPCRPPTGRPFAGFQDDRRYGRDAPVPPLGTPNGLPCGRPPFPSVPYGRGPRTCGPRRIRAGRRRYGSSRRGAVPASGRVWLAFGLPFFVRAGHQDRRSMRLSVPRACRSARRHRWKFQFLDKAARGAPGSEHPARRGPRWGTDPPAAAAPKRPRRGAPRTARPPARARIRPYVDGLRRVIRRGRMRGSDPRRGRARIRPPGMPRHQSRL